MTALIKTSDWIVFSIVNNHMVLTLPAYLFNILLAKQLDPMPYIVQYTNKLIQSVRVEYNRNYYGVFNRH